MDFKKMLLEAITKVSNDDIYDLVSGIHRNPDDFEEGDLRDRIYEYEYYILKKINIDDLNLDEWDVRDYLVDRIKDEIKKDFNYPPIVISSDMSIIDGIHRANALHELGYKTVNAYVGV